MTVIVARALRSPSMRVAIAVVLFFASFAPLPSLSAPLAGFGDDPHDFTPVPVYSNTFVNPFPGNSFSGGVQGYIVVTVEPGVYRITGSGGGETTIGYQVLTAAQVPGGCTVGIAAIPVKLNSLYQNVAFTAILPPPTSDAFVYLCIYYFVHWSETSVSTSIEKVYEGTSSGTFGFGVYQAELPIDCLQSQTSAYTYDIVSGASTNVSMEALWEYHHNGLVAEPALSDDPDAIDFDDFSSVHPWARFHTLPVTGLPSGSIENTNDVMVVPPGTWRLLVSYAGSGGCQPGVILLTVESEDIPTPTLGTPTATLTPPPGCAGMRVVGLNAVDANTIVTIFAGEWVFGYGGDVEYLGDIIPDWSAFPAGLQFPTAGSYVFIARTNEIAPEPTLLRICSAISLATATATVEGTPTNTATVAPTLTPSSTSTPTDTPTPGPTLTPSDTPLPTATVPLDNQDCLIGPVDGRDCEIVNNQRTQIALQLTEIAMMPGTYVPGIPTGAPTGEANLATVSVILCSKDPCYSINQVGGSVVGVVTTMQSYANAPDCATVSFGTWGAAWLDFSDDGFSDGFCFFIDRTETVREIMRALSILLILFIVWRYVSKTMRRLGDV